MAFAARFYAPLHSKTKSRYELYLCDLDGKHLRKITTGANAVEVRWISKSKLAYTSYDDMAVESAYQYWTINADGTGRKKVKNGESAFQFGRVPGAHPFRLADNANMSRFADLLEDNSPHAVDLKSDEKTVTLTNVPGIPNLELPNDYHDTGFNSLFLDKKENRFWATYWTHNSTYGTSICFGTFTAKSLKLVFVNPEAAEIDLTPERKTYAMVTPRDLAPYGKKNVLYSRLYVGDWTKHSWKEIKFGQTVDFKSVAIRP